VKETHSNISAQAWFGGVGQAIRGLTDLAGSGHYVLAQRRHQPLAPGQDVPACRLNPIHQRSPRGTHFDRKGGHRRRRGAHQLNGTHRQASQRRQQGADEEFSSGKRCHDPSGAISSQPDESRGE
jgi:hypothetical protein